MHTRFEVSARAADLDGIDIVGEVDIETAPELQGLIENSLTQGRSIAIGFEQCSYLDSSVINVLVKAHKLATGRGRRVIVVAPNGSGARRVFDVAGLHHLMPVIDSFEQVDSAQGPPSEAGA